MRLCSCALAVFFAACGSDAPVPEPGSEDVASFGPGTSDATATEDLGTSGRSPDTAVADPDVPSPTGSDDGSDTDPGPQLETVGKWRRKVFEFGASGVSTNPFEVALEATFVHTDSGEELTLPGYYDGDDLWKIGFMPTRLGEWTWVTASAVDALSGHSGAIEAVESGHPGLLAADASHTDKWRFADGPLVVPIGVFVNAMLEDASDEQFADMADFVHDADLHLLNFRLSENDRAFESVSELTMHLDRWRRLEQRLEILTERGLGVDVMLYTDDSGKPSFAAQSPQEQLLIRYAVARLCGFPSVLFNSGIDLMEYRDAAWVDWYGAFVRDLDPYGHPVSSRHGGGSGDAVMAGQTYNSVGDRNSSIAGLLAAYAPGDGVPAANNDNFSEGLPGNINGHTPDDLRRAAWKAVIAGGVAFHVRHDALFCPAEITECDRYFHIASLSSELDSAPWLALVNPLIQEHLGEAFAAMQPAPGLVVGGGGKYALADPARDHVLLLALGQSDTWDAGDGGPINVSLAGVVGVFDAQWLDPRSGAATPAGSVDGGATHTFAPPSGQDWLLLLERKDDGGGDPLAAFATARYVRVHTSSSPSWVAWSEIEVIDAGGVNVGLSKPATASATEPGSAAGLAFDSNPDTSWNAGDFPPATITVDLGQSTPLSQVRLSVTQNPPGATTHALELSDDGASFETAHVFEGNTKAGDVLVYPAPAVAPFELSAVTWLHTDVSSWPVTANLSSVTVQGGIICLEYDKKNAWPSVDIPHSSGNGTVAVVANPWVFTQYEGTWYGATWEWLAVGSTCKNKTSVAGDHIKQPPLGPADWTPASGQQLYFMVSGLARDPNIKNVSERSNIVPVTWP